MKQSKLSWNIFIRMGIHSISMTKIPPSFRPHCCNKRSIKTNIYDLKTNQFLFSWQLWLLRSIILSSAGPIVGINFWRRLVELPSGTPALQCPVWTKHIYSKQWRFAIGIKSDIGHFFANGVGVGVGVGASLGQISCLLKSYLISSNKLLLVCSKLSEIDV